MKSEYFRPTRARALLGMAFGFGCISSSYAQNAAPIALEKVCQDDVNEAKLRQRETAMLGAQHAADHASSRAKICRVAKGLEPDSQPVSQLTIAASSAANTANSKGVWGNAFKMPVLAISSVLLHTGNILAWSYNPAYWWKPDAPNTGLAYLYSPNDLDTQSPLPTINSFPINPPNDIWCGGQTIMGDGRVFIAGGNLSWPQNGLGYKGNATTTTFNPNDNVFYPQPSMAHGRWYPTVTKLANNTAVITSGYDETGTDTLNHSIDLFTPSPEINGIGTVTPLNSTDNSTTFYPFQYVLQSGKMLQAGPGASNSAMLDTLPDPQTGQPTWNWSLTGGNLRDHGNYGTGIIYTDASVSPIKQTVVIGGGTDGQGAYNTVDWLDGVNPANGWKQYPSWLTPRHNANMVILADGTLFVVGGNTGTDSFTGPVYSSEIYSKVAGDPTGSWIAAAPNPIRASYHSSAVLLPDARVLLSEDDYTTINNGNADAHQGAIYSPPYLNTGTQRPRILSDLPTATLGSSLSISFSVGTKKTQIKSAVLVAPGATTHGNDMNQRFIKLDTRLTGNTLVAKVPTSYSVVPPGYYMLFIIDSSGVPSVAKFVRIT